MDDDGFSSPSIACTCCVFTCYYATRNCALGEDHTWTSSFGNEDYFFSRLTCGSTMDSNCDACDLLVFGASTTRIPIFSKLTMLTK